MPFYLISLFLIYEKVKEKAKARLNKLSMPEMHAPELLPVTV